MPIFEYICRDCNKSFEKLTRLAERDHVRCAHCMSDRIARKVSLMSPSQMKSTQPTVNSGCGAPACCGGGCAILN